MNDDAFKTFIAQKLMLNIVNNLKKEASYSINHLKNIKWGHE